jgi:hypothetical protein
MLRLVAEHAAACLAANIFEKYLVAAFIAVEGFHGARELTGFLSTTARCLFAGIVPVRGARMQKI